MTQNNKVVGIQFALHPSADVVTQVFIVLDEFIGDCRVCQVFDANIFYGHSFTQNTEQWCRSKSMGNNI